MTTTINASNSGSGGLVQTADASGVLALQTAGTTAVTIDTSQNATFAGYANLPNTFGFKNRIINGAMVIDQRNNGASVNVTNNLYTLDRWVFDSSQTGKLTCQQNAASVTPPAGFANYLGITSSTSYSVLTSDTFTLKQNIEGFNTADLGFGAAGASTVTLSFWVRSSLTGTFGASLVNSAFNRSYPFSYTISSANTWEYKTITVAGDTSGTWVGATNGIGLRVYFNLGAGSTYVGTANTWNAGGYVSPSGATSVVGTSGATFYITGVQLEKGSTATSFDVRSYGTEFQLCQRYFEILGSTSNSLLFQTYAVVGGTGTERSSVYYKVLKRTTPTATVVGTWVYSNGSGLAFGSVGVDCSRVEWSSTAAGVSYAYNNNTGAYLSFSAEL